MTPKAHPDNIILFGNARFTLLTDRFLRIEWDVNRDFCDLKTFAVVNRNLPKVRHGATASEETIEIKTGAFTLHYKETGRYPDGENLSIDFIGGGGRISWRFGEDDHANLLGTLRTLDEMDGNMKFFRDENGAEVFRDVPLEKGLLAKGGVALFDDSRNVCFEPAEGYFEEWPRERGRNIVDLYVSCYDRDYAGALRDMSQVFGKMDLLPRYALGYWYSRYFPYTDQDIRDVINQVRTFRIPMDVMVVDMEWHRPGWTGFSWDTSYLPDPESLLKWIKSRQIRTALNLHPADGVQPHEDRYPAFREAMGAEETGGGPIPFDIADTSFMEHYFRLLLHPLEEQGVDFWWMDWQQGEKSGMENLDPLMLLNKLHYEDREKAGGGERPMIFSRYSGLGSGRYPIGFSGDTHITWKSLRFQPYFTATAANALYGYWSHDIGGHCRGVLEPELFLRWIQFGVYSPVFRIHSAQDRRVWEQESAYRWMMIDEIRKRYDMIPYIYSEMRRGYDEGVSLCHPLYYQYPHEESAYERDGQYFFGREMMVCPVTSPADRETNLSEKEMWIPPGGWIDCAKGRVLEGGAAYVERYGLEETPVFVRAGAVIPGTKDLQHLNLGSYEKLVLSCYPGGDGEYTLYEDDGLGTGYRGGDFVKIRFSQKREKDGASIIASAARGYYPGFAGHKELELHFPFRPFPQSVEIDGRPLDLSAGGRYVGRQLKAVVSLGSVDLSREHRIAVRFPDVSRTLLDGKAGVFSRLISMKEKVRGIMRDGHVLMDFKRDRGFFKLIGICERISYKPEELPGELEAFAGEVESCRQYFSELLDLARAVLRYVDEKGEDPKGLSKAFPHFLPGDSRGLPEQVKKAGIIVESVPEIITEITTVREWCL